MILILIQSPPGWHVEKQSCLFSVSEYFLYFMIPVLLGYLYCPDFSRGLWPGLKTWNVLITHPGTVCLHSFWQRGALSLGCPLYKCSMQKEEHCLSQRWPLTESEKHFDSKIVKQNLEAELLFRKTSPHSLVLNYPVRSMTNTTPFLSFALALIYFYYIWANTTILL